MEIILHAKYSKPYTVAYEEGDSVRKQNLIQFLKINWNLEHKMLKWYRTWGTFLNYRDYIFMNRDFKTVICHVP